MGSSNWRLTEKIGLCWVVIKLQKTWHEVLLQQALCIICCLQSIQWVNRSWSWSQVSCLFQLLNISVSLFIVYNLHYLLPPGSNCPLGSGDFVIVTVGWAGTVSALFDSACSCLIDARRTRSCWFWLRELIVHSLRFLGMFCHFVSQRFNARFRLRNDRFGQDFKIRRWQLNQFVIVALWVKFLSYLLWPPHDNCICTSFVLSHIVIRL